MKHLRNLYSRSMYVASEQLIYLFAYRVPNAVQRLTRVTVRSD